MLRRTPKRHDEIIQLSVESFKKVAGSQHYPGAYRPITGRNEQGKSSVWTVSLRRWRGPGDPRHANSRAKKRKSNSTLGEFTLTRRFTERATHWWSRGPQAPTRPARRPLSMPAWGISFKPAGFQRATRQQFDMLKALVKVDVDFAR
jgi:hypothetical protein